ncbi:hypothetical protein DM806_18655 [Sphingobium lactosutens]|uniref:hypothetical protein n=1 Tax=Sphingobium lactosutens TaxID=522773 RepID=UPI0015C0C5EE|nr:hypothetical protein [Sphingobium lactosutens]NWK97639.1 hypothetical protein [Sphingobium lactosutens]
MRFFILPGLMILAACGSGTPNRSTDAAPASNSVAGTGEAAKPVPEAVDTASVEPIDVTMPDFAPRYPGSTVAVVVPAAGGGSHEVRLTTQDDADAVMLFYRDRFAAAGLRKTSDFVSGGTGMMSAIGKGRKAAIAIARERDHNVIIITYSGA